MTQSTQSIYRQILKCVEQEIKLLGLVSIPQENVITIKEDLEREFIQPKVPGVIIFPLTERMNQFSGTNIRDDVQYPVRVDFFDSEATDMNVFTDDLTKVADPDAPGTGAPDQEAYYDRRLLWREQMRKRFSHTRFEAINSVWDCVVEPAPILDRAAWRSRNLWKQGLILRFMSRETRGAERDTPA